MTDEQIKDWLAKHAADLEPEELLFEEEKARAIEQTSPNNGSWPVPQKVLNMKVFDKIDSVDEFNRIIGDPDNWETILSNTDLYNNWILPNAVLLFGKTWFDRVKWRSSIHRSVLFPLFTTQDKRDAKIVGGIENTTFGKSRIVKVSKKVGSSLEVYLTGKWRAKTSFLKKPGGYIIESIKNETIREVGNDLGYKFVSVLACPYCLASNKVISYKTPLVWHSDKQYECPRCKDLEKNLLLNVCNLKAQGNFIEAAQTEKLSQKANSFSYFIGVTCICPNDKCEGKFVPLTCVDYSTFDPSRYKLSGALKKFSLTKDTQSFKEPPETLYNLPLTCPFCDTNFTPKSALGMKSGFKGKSGHLTGLPSISIWMKREINKLDSWINQDKRSLGTFKDNLTTSEDDPSSKIVSAQRLNLLIGEVIIQMSRTNKKSSSGFMTWLFYKAAISWMMRYRRDADRYFFGWSSYQRNMTEKEKARYPGQTTKKMTNTHRGSEAAIHFSFLQEWFKMIENNIHKLHKIDPNTKDLKDLSWFCCRPKFSGGPKITFVSSVDSNGRIANKTRVRSKTSSHTPRMVKIYSIYKTSDRYYNHVNSVNSYDWQSIRLSKDSILIPGDKVKVEALIMSGHPTHAPIQRIIRLRSMILQSIINRILNEEMTGDSDSLFWDSWRKRAELARNKTGQIFKEQ